MQGIWTSWWGDADWVVRGVFLVLIGMSVLSWTVILAKVGRFARVLRGERAATATLDSAGSDDELDEGLSAFLPTRALVTAVRGLRRAEAGALRDRDRLTAHLERWLGEQRLVLGNNLTLLATIGNSAPFIGLFGTVWGIMHALQTLGSAEALTLEAVAGPVGEALVATAAGLFTAIPAVIGYNLLVRLQNRIMAVVAINAQRLLDRVTEEG